MLKKRFAIILFITLITPILLVSISTIGSIQQNNYLSDITSKSFLYYQQYSEINRLLLLSNRSAYITINKVNAGQSAADLKHEISETEQLINDALKISNEIFSKSKNETDKQSIELINAYSQELTTSMPTILLDVSVGAMMMDSVNIKFQTALDNVSLRLNQISKEVADETQMANAKSRFAIILSLICSALLTALSVLLILFISKDLIKKLTKIATGLSESSIDTDNISHSLASDSFTLSSTAQQQSSAITQTTASIEEIDGILKTNLETISQTSEKALSMKTQSTNALTDINKLETAMDNILSSTQDIKKLVSIIGDIGEKTKIMDEIVFQTKLLSFNASVEAERAGEHGRGFAVVAQEVGNLAQMSGKSAKEISDILAESIKKAEQITSSNEKAVNAGNLIVKSTSEILKTITNESVMLSTDAQTVHSASIEQEKGIDQINKAMIELEKSTTHTTSLIEKGSVNSQKMAEQTAQIKSIVDNLKELVS